MNFTLAQLQTGLGVSLACTVVILFVALALAHKHKAKAHIAGIVLFLVSFVVTLFFAETLGRRYTFEHVSYPIHMTIAIFTTGFTVIPLVTGAMHWQGKAKRETHKKISMAWFVSVVLALGTGGWMMSHGELISERGAPGDNVAPVTSKT